MFLNDRLGFFVVGGFLLLIVAIGFGEQRLKEKQLDLKENCVKTNLFIIKNKGTIGQVYDCAERGS